LAAALAAALGVCLDAVPARAQSCPGNPNALGTSRVLAIDPSEYKQVGVMQYAQSLPLADKEVVLTFDDGPLPRYSDAVLDILAAQCVKATYFLVGEMARAYPATVRRIYEEGHTIGTHSENHPTRFGQLPIEKMRWEIDQGIADVGAALGDPNKLAPFFRIPGFARSGTVENELAARSLVVFSSDTVADDWHHRIKPAQITALAMSRLEKRGKGILLLHDIHPATLAALPGLLKELKDQGFRVVQVVPAAPAAPAEPEIAATPKAWIMASAMPDQVILSEDPAETTWPQPTVSLPPDDIVLPAPDAAAFDIGYGDGPAAGFAIEIGGGDVRWPEQSPPILPSSGPELPAPSVEDIGMALQERQLFGKDVGPRPDVDITGSTDHGQLRQDRLHAHRHNPAAADGQHADLFVGIRALAALFTPAR
jgi:peptidoglycan/xylan/chitin deacetylase (PgdA/CDA1 family)